MAEIFVSAKEEAPHRRKAALVIGICAGALTLVFGVFALLYWGLQVQLFDRSGWAETRDGAACYRDYYGRPLLGWQTISDGRYFFSPEDGAVHSGWLEWENKRYFLAEDGRVRSGWLKEADGLRYLDETGAMQTGWLELPQGAYYLLDDGLAATGWKQLGEDTYWFAQDGKMHTGWLESGQDRYYMAADGKMQTGWVELPEGIYYLDAEGKMQTGWLELEDKRYYLGNDGARVSGWLTGEDGRFYLAKTGELVTGFAEIDGVKRYFTPSGAYIVLANPWNPVPDDFALNLMDCEGAPVDASCLKPLQELLAACRAEGYDCRINYAYRDIALQQELWDNRYNSYIQAGYSPERAWELTAQVVAVPGTSEHHLGLAVDLGTSEAGYRWLEEHGWEFGFIMRYPDGKTDATGIVYEMWHYRYVGVDVAEAVYSSGLCLEEYLDLLEAEVRETEM